MPKTNKFGNIARDQTVINLRGEWERLHVEWPCLHFACICCRELRKKEKRKTIISYFTIVYHLRALRDAKRTKQGHNTSSCATLTTWRDGRRRQRPGRGAPLPRLAPAPSLVMVLALPMFLAALTGGGGSSCASCGSHDAAASDISGRKTAWIDPASENTMEENIWPTYLARRCLYMQE